MSTIENEMTVKESLVPDFVGRFVDLAAQRLGGETLSCSDDFFAEMENLLKPGRGVFITDKYTERGKWMDGWESRRSYGRTDCGRDDGRDFDWCIVALGVPGEIHGFDVDTHHFRGNAPQEVSIEACVASTDSLAEASWTQLLPKASLVPHSQNYFEIDPRSFKGPKGELIAWTHLRLNMYPDGGIARFRVYGDPIADPKQFLSGELIDLAAIKNGARALLCSDMFFSDKNNLLMPGRGVNMGDGWETKRRRDPGPDWSVIKLAFRGSVNKVVVDTAHFKGNYPDRFSLQGLVGDDETAMSESAQWQEIIAETKLSGNHEHLYIDEIVSAKEASFTHLRINIFPDGGLSRLRVFAYKKSSDTVNEN